MTRIPSHMLPGVSFPDCEVTRFQLVGERLECWLDGCYLAERGLVESAVRLTVARWGSVEIVRHDAERKESMQVALADAGKLKDICECRLTGTSAHLAGFERFSGSWQSLEFASALVSLEIEA